ncbi:TetR family transcriptional regulator C-terminal domain-containing protein [Sanguibacter sp. 25GB23B1]|uniref:TetR family transcriptional regulator C-terminal domain-containing protein n=1 Tax=unclassified Sanguibacter TaxID=2645534 RepID=UPI0032AF5F49
MTSDPPRDVASTTKDQLLVDLLRLRDVAAEDAAVGDTLHGLAFLDHLVDVAVRNTAQPGSTQLYTVLSAESVTLDHPAQPWFRTRYAELRTTVASALGEARDIGEIRDDADIEETATAIVAVMDGLQVQWLLDPDAVDMPAVLRRTLDALLAALVPDED